MKKVMSFGKYRGAELVDVAMDKNYCQFLLDQPTFCVINKELASTLSELSGVEAHPKKAALESSERKILIENLARKNASAGQIKVAKMIFDFSFPNGDLEVNQKHIAAYLEMTLGAARAALLALRKNGSLSSVSNGIKTTNTYSIAESCLTLPTEQDWCLSTMDLTDAVSITVQKIKTDEHFCEKDCLASIYALSMIMGAVSDLCKINHNEVIFRGKSLSEITKDLSDNMIEKMAELANAEELDDILDKLNI